MIVVDIGLSVRFIRSLQMIGYVIYALWSNKMTQSFDALKRCAIQDILSVSGKEKVARVADNHISNIIEVSLIKGAASRQAEIDELVDTIKTSADSEAYLFDELQAVKSERDELQKRIDEALRFYNEAKSPHNIGMIQVATYLKGQNNENK